MFIDGLFFKSVLTLSFLFCSGFLMGQSDREETKKLYQDTEALMLTLDSASSKQVLANCTQIINLYTVENMKPDTLLANAYLSKGAIYHTFGQYRKALTSYLASFDIRKKMFATQDSLMFKNYVCLGQSYYEMLDYDSAEYYFIRAQQVSTYWKDSIEGVENFYNQTGVLYLSQGNAKQACTFFQKAINNSSGISAIYFALNLAGAFSKSGEYIHAIQEYRKLLQYTEYLSYLPLYNNLGYNYTKTGNLDSALFYLRKAIFLPQPTYQVAAFRNLGNAFLADNTPDSAAFYFHKAISLGEETLSIKHTALTEAYIGLATLAERKNHWWLALQYYQQALVKVTYDFEDTSIFVNPVRREKMLSLPDVFRLLQAKGKAFYQYYQQTQDTVMLHRALPCYEQAIALAQHIQRSYDTDDAKLFFTSNINSIFADALQTVYAMYALTGDPKYVSQGLCIAETGKASVLSEMLKEIAIKASGTVNDSLIREEHQLKQKITAMRIQLAQSSDSAQNAAHQEAILDLEIALARTIKALQQDEKFYRLKYQTDSLDIAALQQQVLTDDAAMLEYVSGPDALYIFLLTKDRIDLKKVSLNQAFQFSLTQTQNRLYHYEVGQPYSLQPYNSRLYETLIQPFAQEIAQKSKLIIVPDGQLSYLPFDVLAASETPERYLLRDYTISYSYAIRLLQDAVMHRRDHRKDNVLAMAPFAGNAVNSVRNQSFATLTASEDEVRQTGGSIYVSGKATKQLFLKMAGSYGILHLATHATVNSEQPLDSYIAFYPNADTANAGFRLYTRELYNLNLDNAQLVVLSACDAGNGKLVKGEGIISLARAFAYAGCPNIMSTLWSADDRASARIATSVYQYLKEGYAKDEALRQAKLDYLNSDIHPILKAPAIWANFIFIGDPAPIYQANTHYYYLAFGLLLLLAAWLGWKYYRKVDSRRRKKCHPSSS